MQQAVVRDKEVSEELPEYTSEISGKVRNMVVIELNRKSLRGTWPFPLLPEPKNHYFAWIAGTMGGIAAILGVLRGLR